jgi:2-amino-4-hydroxy-6-hydroxymethyldihydropteridine diphosphokinase
LELLVMAFGSNLGDRADNLAQARQLMNEIWESPSYSRIYQTLPWGITDQPLFLNQVGMGYTEKAPLEILTKVKGFEVTMGRTEGPRNGPRVIDLDILYYSNWVFISDTLTIPHPRLHERAFTLVPLVDLLPDWVHPILKKTHQQLLSHLNPSEASCQYYASL